MQGTSWTGPGAYNGDFYARISRRPNNAFMAAEFAPQSTGIIHAEWMEYVPRLMDDGNGNADDYAMGVMIGNVNSTDDDMDHPAALAVYTKPVTSGQVKYWHDGDQNYYTVYAGASVLTYTVDAWCKWELDLDLDANTYTLTIDGVTSNVLPAVDVTVSAFALRAGANRGTAYIDSESPSGHDPGQRYCGDFATQYLDGDVSGPQEGVPDCYVNLYDLMFLANGWLACTDPAVPDNCE